MNALVRAGDGAVNGGGWSGGTDSIPTEKPRVAEACEKYGVACVAVVLP
jgi:hypothetical protein